MLILSHTLYLRTGAAERAIAIAIEVFKPEPRQKAWACRYVIDWPEAQQTFESRGGDPLQALVLALQMIGSEIYTSAYHREGRLRAYDGEEGYGFPVPGSLRDLLVGADKIAM